MSILRAPPLPRPGTRLPTAEGGAVVAVAWRAEGSYAHVYRAAYAPPGHLPLDALPCALKVPRPEVPPAAERLRAEGEVLSRVHHPHLVRLLARGAAGCCPLLVLEWLEGSPVTLRGRGLPLARALELLEQLLLALGALHAAGAAHGDVRPQNLLLTEERGAVLIDPDGAAADPGADLRAAAALFRALLTGSAAAPDHPLPAALNPRAEALRRQLAASSPSPWGAVEAARAAAALRATL